MWRALLLSLGLATPAGAECDLALILALDISGSVSPDEWALQRDGLAAALRDGAVTDALVEAEAQVAVIQWTGDSRQIVAIDWTETTTPEEVGALADAVAAQTREWRDFSTAIGQALRLATELFAEGPDCRRRVIDVSGDGRSNEGVTPQSQWPALDAAGITVNALVIEGAEPGLTAYFETEVITGEGAFALTANGYGAYPRRIRQKLLREVVPRLSLLAP